MLLKPLLFAGLLSLLLWSSASSSLNLLAIPVDNDILLPGSMLASPFGDAVDEDVTLPKEGRYLLWIADAAFALENREGVPQAEFIPQARASQVLFNPTAALIPRFQELGRGHIVFYEGYGLLPDRSERDEIRERFRGFDVVYDSKRGLTREYSAGRLSLTAAIDGLYLMEGQQLRYRYFFPSVWENHGIAELIFEGARAFLAGEEPEVVPVVPHSGNAVPRALLPLETPMLVLRIGGNEAEAPRLSGFQFEHPGAANRFLLEELPPLLRRYGVGGVALVFEGSGPIPELERTFPDWVFVPMESPRERLAWLEVRAAVVDSEGRIHLPLLLLPDEQEDVRVLENALRVVGADVE